MTATAMENALKVNAFAPKAGLVKPAISRDVQVTATITAAASRASVPAIPPSLEMLVRTSAVPKIAPKMVSVIVASATASMALRVRAVTR